MEIGLFSYTVIPPSTLNVVPLMYAASSDAKNAYAFAISLGSPNLPTGTLAFMVSITFSGIAETIEKLQIQPDQFINEEKVYTKVTKLNDAVILHN